MGPWAARGFMWSNSVRKRLPQSTQMTPSKDGGSPNSRAIQTSIGIALGPSYEVPQVIAVVEDSAQEGVGAISLATCGDTGPRAGDLAELARAYVGPAPLGDLAADQHHQLGTPRPPLPEPASSARRRRRDAPRGLLHASVLAFLASREASASARATIGAPTCGSAPGGCASSRARLRGCGRTSRALADGQTPVLLGLKLGLAGLLPQYVEGVRAGDRHKLRGRVGADCSAEAISVA